MVKSITEQLVELLLEMQTTASQIEASGLISVGGLSMAFSLPGGGDPDILCGQQAELLLNAQNLISQYSIGSFEFVCVQGKYGVNLLIPVNEKCFLSVLARNDVEDIAKRIKQFAPKIAALVY